MLREKSGAKSLGFKNPCTLCSLYKDAVILFDIERSGQT